MTDFSQLNKPDMWIKYRYLYTCFMHVYNDYQIKMIEGARAMSMCNFIMPLKNDIIQYK